MRKIVVAILCLVLLVGCGNVTSVKKTYDSEDKPVVSNFVIVERTTSWAIVYHKDTKVMYSVSASGYNHGNFTLLVNPDGTPMLYEEG